MPVGAVARVIGSPLSTDVVDTVVVVSSFLYVIVNRSLTVIVTTLVLDELYQFAVSVGVNTADMVAVPALR